MPARGATTARATAAVTAVLLGLAGCDAAPSTGSRGPAERVAVDQHAQPSDKPTPVRTEAKLTTNVSAHAHEVTVDTPVTVSVDDGTLDKVEFTVQHKEHQLPGTFSDDKTTWTADDLLEPGTRYVVSSRATDAAGLPTKTRVPFRTEHLTLPEQTYPSITPLQNEVVGVGMPVIVQFDVPVRDRAEFERHLHVTARPATTGSWHWMSDQEVHWRPKSYWQPGTSVDVNLDVNGVAAGNGIYGQMDRSVSFEIGRAVVMKVNLKSDHMKVLVNGRLARTIPVTGGKPGFETRSGTKLIVEKFESKRMDAATVGVSPSSPEYYNIANVQYAQRVTFTGEFLHAAPWSVYAQGSSNVSHGCVGMSIDNAAWLYGLTHRGDPVEVTGTDRGLEDGNGWTDWNETFADYKQGSAL
jgi:lipoprotein-anchoring transpeptidase ErfK/SrfK